MPVDTCGWPLFELLRTTTGDVISHVLFLSIGSCCGFNAARLQHTLARSPRWQSLNAQSSATNVASLRSRFNLFISSPSANHTLLFAVTRRRVQQLDTALLPLSSVTDMCGPGLPASRNAPHYGNHVTSPRGGGRPRLSG